MNTKSPTLIANRSSSKISVLDEAMSIVDNFKAFKPRRKIRKSTETLAVNVTGKVRRETLQGREYLVAPVRMIVEGVLNGSKGALFYPRQEYARDPSVWNGMPLVRNHPTDERGNHVSARSADILEKFGLGMVLSANTESGNLDAEAWFDVEQTKRVDNELYQRIASGKPIELSTGLFTDNYPAPRGAVHNGKAYQYVARNYRPDHLAILPDQKGACSLQDGCGVLVNEKQEDCKCGGACDECKKKKETESMTPTGNSLWKALFSLFKVVDAAANPTNNVFCPTGAGGGVDSSCSKNGGGGSNDVSRSKAGSDKEYIKSKGFRVAYKDVGQGTLAGLKAVITDKDNNIVHVTKEVRGGKGAGAKLMKLAADWVEQGHTNNASVGQIKDAETGKWLPNGAGTGKGPIHKAAAAGYRDEFGIGEEEDSGVEGLEAEDEEMTTVTNGGPGSGNFGHAGCPGSVGGSCGTGSGSGGKGSSSKPSGAARGKVKTVEVDGKSLESATVVDLPDFSIGGNLKTSSHLIGDHVTHAGKSGNLVHIDPKGEHITLKTKSGEFVKLSTSDTKQRDADLAKFKQDIQKGSSNKTSVDLAKFKGKSIYDSKYMVDGNKANVKGAPVKIASSRYTKQYAGKTGTIHSIGVDMVDVKLSDGSIKSFSTGDVLHNVSNQEDHTGSSVTNVDVVTVLDHLEGEPDMALTSNDRKKLIAGLTANCECQEANVFNEEDAEMLEGLTDNQLVGLVKQKKAIITANEMPPALKSAADKKKAAAEESDDEEEMTENRLTPEEQEDLAYARRAKQARKEQVINQLVANVSDDAAKKAKVAKLNQKTLNELEELLDLMPAPTPTNNATQTSYSPVLYFGAAPVVNSNKAPTYNQDDALPIPTMNWEEEAKLNK